MIYPRNLSLVIKPFFRRPEIIAIKGPRQSGKTTLLRCLYEELSAKHPCVYLTFEKLTDREIFENDIENFKKIYAEPTKFLFIDEFQYARDGGQKLKYLYDTTKSKIFISGSSSLELMAQTGRYLVGRLFSFYLFPFSFSEFLKIKDSNLYKSVFYSIHQQIKKFLFGEIERLPKKTPLSSESLRNRFLKILDEFIVYGGYPAVVTARNDMEKQEILRGIKETYLQREIKNLLVLTTDRELIAIAKLLALQIGNLVVYQEITDTLALNFQELKKHLRILEETFVVEFILPYFVNKRTEIVKNPKAYFLDTGLRNLLLQNFSSLDLRPDRGALAENFVFGELKKIGGGQIKFWRTKNQAEVDFVWERGREIIPIEVKFTSQRDTTTGKSYCSFLEKYRPKHGLIITRDFWGQRRVNNTLVYFIPAFYL